ncbi:GNAT family N-acetyltransferase [Streptomyces sp. SID8379]|uniref:GNAT family N-acetyltransferase n=1 Tax=unclassified Streptomyces TaxID=2593676 RepID=UPI00037762B2|nr:MULTISPECIES: GNAT family protein [unclassified Streptomyces]MYW64754.1 GNAT family N-acetyltransferase [Streptomyces sp. SID8379]
MLITPDIELRRAEAADAQALVDAVIRNKDHMRATEPYRAPDYYTAKAQEERITSANGVVWLLFEGERVVGRVELSGIVRGPLCGGSVGYWVDGDYRGRGLIPAAVEEVAREARDELGLHRLEAGTLVDNTASQRVLAKCGFERFGLAPGFLHIDGAWRDHILFQRLLHDDPPPHIPK